MCQVLWRTEFMEKLTENEVILILSNWLLTEGWQLKEPIKLNRQKGIDIFLEKNGMKMIIEAKGAKGNPNDKNVKRSKFNSGQIKTHFGKAIVKALEAKTKYCHSIIAIAHPDDPDIKKALKESLHHIQALGINHFWVSSDTVVEGY